ncbi:MAG: hypothetical protein JSW37_04940 [Anaerolineales bacterium]|nr:MAG: hypothetical protein JSW37_04940 [Anaerolineales bacterium]
MSRRGKWIRIGVILALLIVGVPRIGCRRTPSLDDALSSIAEPYRFSILRWQLSQLLGRPEPAGQPDERGADSSGASELVVEYFSLVDQARTAWWEADAIAAGVLEGDLAVKLTELENLQTRRDALTDSVRRILAWQIRDTLNRQGIFNPVDRLLQVGVSFPPVNFRLDRPPNVLIVSPRERIESIREIMLVQELDQDQFEDIEASVDKLGVSSLVTELGGFGGTYPTFVAGDVSLPWTIATATEEWLHQYLAFTPLGFMYLLDSIGIARNYEIATINETVAGIVSGEIAELVMAAYYPQYGAPSSGGSSSGTGIDFNRTMRELRLAVDELLANGEIEQAESLMEERRQLLVSNGYSIRKLNQAYFAFYGTYADEPTSVSPIGIEVSELRRGSVSLRDFVNRAAAMTSRQDLINALKTPSDEEGLLVRLTRFGRAADMRSLP